MQVNKIRETFEKKFGKDYRTFRAPGRINLIGEHTDYNMGFVMPGAIDKSIHLCIHPENHGKYRIFAANIDVSVELDAKQDLEKQNMPGWAKYPAGVIIELQKQGHQIPGFNAVFGGNIPSGAGLSSSAALESVFGVALNALFGLGLTPFEIAQTGQMAEHNTVGVKCGIMDQFASVFGQKDQLIRLDCRDLSFDRFPFMDKEHTLLLADTQVKHSLASSAYNERRSQCEEGVKAIAAKNSNVKSLRDVTIEMLESVKSEIDPVVYQRCKYVIDENERLHKASEALKRSDMDLLGELLLGSHYGLKDEYEVSCEELDFLVALAEKDPSVKGSRMMGGGFGGCTINLIRKDGVEEFKKSTLQQFTKRFGTECAFYNVSIADGAGEV